LKATQNGEVVAAHSNHYWVAMEEKDASGRFWGFSLQTGKAEKKGNETAAKALELTGQNCRHGTKNDKKNGELNACVRLG